MSKFELRKDINIKIEVIDNENLITLNDPLALNISNVIVPIHLLEFIKILIKGIDINELSQVITDLKLIENEVNNVILNLDKFCLLENSKVVKLRNSILEFQKIPIRPNVCMGNLYSSNPEIFIEEIKQIVDLSKEKIIGEFKTKLSSNNKSNDVNLIFAPHIDFNIGLNSLEAYSTAFSNLHFLDYDLVVLLGTAHFKNSGYFMFSDKEYQTPLNNLSIDKELINQITDEYQLTNNIYNNNNDPNTTSILIDNLAHKDEHSIELHAIFVSYFNNLKNKDKSINTKILPILTGSIEGKNMNQNDYNAAIEIIKKNIFDKYKKVLFLCSGDLSHIGRKFNDNYDALDEIQNLKPFENNLIKMIENYEIDNFYHYLNENNKKWKVCGFAPFYAGMKLAEKSKGNILNHSIWYERPKKSLVSFMSMSFD